MHDSNGHTIGFGVPAIQWPPPPVRPGQDRAVGAAGTVQRGEREPIVGIRRWSTPDYVAAAPPVVVGCIR